MEASITFNIYVMSYRRPDKIVTKNSVGYCTYVVREEEAEEYGKNVDNLLVIPKGARLKNLDPVNDFMSTFYWIIENTPEEVICIIDDDVQNFAYMLNDATDIKDVNVATNEIERIAQLLVDLRLGFACDYPVAPLYFYDREIAFKGMPGSTRWINKAAFKAKYRQDDPASGDVDMMMQELLMNRVIIMPKYFHAVSPDIGKNKGGTTNTSNEEYKRLLAMKQKWGKYFSFNFKRNIANINVTR